MNTATPLHQLERSAYRSQVDHGLIDIFIGAFLIAIGLMLHADLEYMPTIVFIVGAIAYPRARRELVEPHAGHVRLSAERMTALRTRRWLTLGALLAVVLGIVALRGLGWIDFPAVARPLVVAGCIAISLMLAAGLFGIGRFFAYAVLVFIGGTIEFWFALEYGLNWYFTGGLIVLAGLTLLVRFVRRHSGRGGDPNGA